MNFQSLSRSIKAAKRFGADETGSVSVFGVVMFVGFAAVGAIALDVSNLYASRTHLQIAADQAAHAALYNRNRMEAEDAKRRALDIVNATLPSQNYGVVLTAEDIEFGVFDRANRTFTPDDDSTSAVMVRTSFTQETSNPVATYLFKLIGQDSFDVTTSAIYTTYRPACLREGFVAEGIVDLQSNNGFSNAFRIHSNTHVSLNSNNFFEPGTVVSMPDLAALDLPKSGFETNEGLRAALRASKQNIRVLSRIDGIIARFEQPLAYISGPDVPELPDYITDPEVVTMTERTVATADLTAGRIHHIDCTGPRLTVDAKPTLRDVVIVSPCEIKFAAGSVLENVIVISKKATADSINAPSGLQVGRNDNCAEGGGAQLITVGGMHFASDLRMYGGQLLARGDIEFAANANGIQGASMIAGGRIDGTSNMDMGFCGSGQEDNFEIDYFRLSY